MRKEAWLVRVCSVAFGLLCATSLGAQRQDTQQALLESLGYDNSGNHIVVDLPSMRAALEAGADLNHIITEGRHRSVLGTFTPRTYQCNDPNVHDDPVEAFRLLFEYGARLSAPTRASSSSQS